MGTRDKKVDAYIAKSRDFARPILTHIRAVVHAAHGDLDEAIKWGMPWFCYKGKLVAYMSAFTRHAAFGFYGGERVIGEGMENREAMGSFGRLTTVRDLPSKRIMTSFVKRAVAIAEAHLAGGPPRRRVKPEAAVPAGLARALKADAALRARWKAFTPGRRREYANWIAGAKQEATRARRLTTAIAQIREGKPQNWKYEAKRA